MSRLTKKYSGGYGLVNVKDDEQAIESSYPNTLKAILGCFGRLGEIEDILYAPDGTELVPLARLREICTAEQAGTLHIAPCKIGDKVTARVSRPYTGHGATIHGEVSDIQLVFRVRYDSVRHVDFLASDFGKTVSFAADAALAKGGEQP